MEFFELDWQCCLHSFSVTACWILHPSTSRSSEKYSRSSVTLLHSYVLVITCFRNLCSENCTFKTEWEFDYLFIFNKDNKPQCLVCLQVFSVLKEYNLKRHYITNHQKKYNDHSCESRKIVIEQLLSLIHI